MTPPKAQLRFDYQQSLLLGEVRSASPKKYMKKNCCQRATETLGVTPMRRRSSIREAVKNLALVRTSHSKSSPQRANINFFSPIFLFFFVFFFYQRDGLRRKGGTARILTPGWQGLFFKFQFLKLYQIISISYLPKFYLSFEKKYLYLHLKLPKNPQNIDS